MANVKTKLAYKDCQTASCLYVFFLSPIALSTSATNSRLLYDALDLEEASKPPYLEQRLADDDANDKQIPPLDSGIGALGGVTVCALADDDVLLLVLDLSQEIGELTDYMQISC